VELQDSIIQLFGVSDGRKVNPNAQVIRAQAFNTPTSDADPVR
jgi:hypothetical protein